jgi:hypothetical protein
MGGFAKTMNKTPGCGRAHRCTLSQRVSVNMTHIA